MSLTVPSQDAGWRVEVDAVEDSTHGVDLVAALSAATAALAASPGSTITVERDVVLELQGSTPQGGDLSLPRGSYYRVVVDGSSVMQTRDDLAAAVIEALNRKVASPGSDVRVVHDVEIVVELLPAPPSTQEIAIGMALETDTALSIAVSGGASVEPFYSQEWDYADTAAMLADPRVNEPSQGGTVELDTDTFGSVPWTGNGYGSTKVFQANFPGGGGEQYAGIDLYFDTPVVGGPLTPRHLWIDGYIWLPAGWDGWAWKTFFLNEFNNPNGANRTEWKIYADHILPQVNNGGPYQPSLPSLPTFPVTTEVWHYWRMERRIATDGVTDDGIYRFWWDGIEVLLADAISPDQDVAASYFYYMQLGRNASPSSPFSVFWGPVRAWNQDPGWL